MSADAKNFSHFRAGAMQAMKPFGPGSHLSKVTSRTSIELGKLKDGKMSLYIGSSPQHMKAYGPWFGLLFQMLSYVLVSANNNKPVDIIAEEVNNMACQPLPNILTLLRTYGVKPTLYIQNLADTKRVYSQEIVDLILSECHVKIMLGAGDYQTAEMFSKLAGDVERVSRGFHLGGDRPTPSTSLESVPLMRPQEFLRLPKGVAVAQINRLPIAKLEMLPYSAQRPLARAVGVNRLSGGRRWIKRPQLWIRRAGGTAFAKGKGTLKPAKPKGKAWLSRAIWISVMRSGLIPTLCFAALLVGLLDSYGAPAVLIDSRKCVYVGVTGIFQDYQSHGCSFFIVKRSW